MANAATRVVATVAANEVGPAARRDVRSPGSAAARALLFLVRREEAPVRPAASDWWVALRDLRW